MRQTLVFVINAGEKTCASEPGKFCKYVRTRAFGTVFSCALFEETLWEDKPGGSLQRVPRCLSGGDIMVKENVNQ